MLQVLAHNGTLAEAPAIISAARRAAALPYNHVAAHGGGRRTGLCCALAQVCASKGRHVATIMDLQGPEIRTSFLRDRDTGERISKLTLKAGEHVTLYGTDNLAEDAFVGFRVPGQVRQRAQPFVRRAPPPLNAAGERAFVMGAVVRWIGICLDTSAGSEPNSWAHGSCCVAQGVRLGLDLADVAMLAKVGTTINLMDGAISLEVTEQVSKARRLRPSKQALGLCCTARHR